MMRGLSIVGIALLTARMWAAEEDELGKLEHEESVRSEHAAQLCRELPGYTSFQDDFEFPKKATIGLINSFPESLYVRIQAKHPRFLDAVWWWDPLDKSGRPKVDWNGFRRAYEDASQRLGHYSWLEQWKHAQPGRSIELHLFGTEIGETDFEMKTFHIPVWKDASFKGIPGYSVLLRRPDDSWIHVLFGRDDRRALMDSSRVKLRDGQTPHWLDRFDLSFHPRGKRSEKYSKYLVISASGDRQLKTYSKAPEGPPKKVIPVTYAGGDGSSFDTAVIVKASDESTGVAGEYAYLRKHYPGYQSRSQSVKGHNGKTYDVLQFNASDGTEHTIYFDITDFFGKL